MKDYRSLGGLVFLFIATLLVPSLSAWADDDAGISIFSGRDQVRPGWMVDGWAGLKVTTSDHGGRTPGTGYVSTTLDAKSVPWSGLAFHVIYGQDQLSGSIPLTSDLSATGVVEMYLNCGKGLDGKAGGGQKLKVSIGFMTKDGKSVPVTTDELPALDSDGDSWELIRIPLAPLLAKLPDASVVAGISSIGIQYVEAPTCEIEVTDCSLKAK